ncbi:trap-type c4-dicarboxylate transport system [Afipia carboxidovorans OM5]|nr:trap-type c4-dicarboxylate transport system [Afipia carboxidovorans OM5]
MNKGIFGKLSDQEKAWVRKAADEAERHGWKAVTVRVEHNYAEMRKHGMTVIDKPNDAAVATLSKAGAELIKRWEQTVGPAGKEAIARYRGNKN